MSSGSDKPTLEFQCPKCSKRLRAGASIAGKTLKCPACGSQVKVPGAQSSSTDDDWLNLDEPSPKPASSGSASTGKAESSKPKPGAGSTSSSKPSSPKPSTHQPLAVDFDADDEFRLAPEETAKPAPKSSSKSGTSSPAKPAAAAPSGPSIFDDDLPELAELEPVQSAPKKSKDEFGLDGIEDLLPPIDLGDDPVSLDAAKKHLELPPESQQYRVACLTCGTGQYVLLSEKGQKRKCPDCFSEFVIPPPPPNWKPGTTPPNKKWGTNLVEDDVRENAGKRSREKADEYLAKAQEELADEEIDTLYSGDFDNAGFVKRTFGFIFDPAAVIQALAYAFAFAVLFGVFQWGRLKVLEDPQSSNIGYIFISYLAVPILFIIVGFPLFAASMALLQSVSNGQDRVPDWPGLTFMDDLGEIFVFFAAFGLSALPGVALGWVLGSTGGLGWMVSLAVTASTFLLFPVVLISMLDNGSFFEPFSRSVFNSLKESTDAWAAYYMKTFVAFGALELLSVLLLQWGEMGAAVYGFLVPWLIFYTCQQLGVVATQINEHLSTGIGGSEEKKEADDEELDLSE